MSTALAKTGYCPEDLLSMPDGDMYELVEVGVSLVWIVSPATQTVTVYRRDGTSTLLRENDAIGGEDVLPGFKC